MIRVWDPLLRLFHWGLVAGFAVAYLSAEDGQTLHQLSGYAVGGLVAFRLVWGLIGSRHARFAGFVRGPGAVLAYLRDMIAGRERRYLGHNPAGGAMIVVLLISLAGVVGTGLALDPGTAGLREAAAGGLPALVTPARADEDDGESEGLAPGGNAEAIAALHEVFSTLLLILIALHIAGVVVASRRHGENLVRAMVTGDKRAPGDRDVA